ncbi:nucleolar protein 8-like [Stylophora pistillata]|nr:nucleolar protein 8-like [Stylophora pistillata]
METNRLFVGGLYSGIKEVDLRDRFNAFGTVSSVEVIQRADENGCTTKTFAYVDILQTEKDFRRCVSLLSNSKWRGCCLKIQPAKESFLTRLQRERQQQAQANFVSPLQEDTKQFSPKRTIAHHKKDTEKGNSFPETLVKAVPGTPLPGKKNWVVGKFGRVLPVMYLRRRDRKKIAKFDPSKTTHCLKKIKLEETDNTIAELTWNFQSEEDILNVSSGNLLKGKKKNKHKSKSAVTVEKGKFLNDSFEEQDLTEDVGTDSSESHSGRNVVRKIVETRLSREITDDIREESLAIENGHSEESVRSVPQLEEKLLSQVSGNEGSSVAKTFRKDSSLDSNQHFSVHNGTSPLEVERNDKQSFDGTGVEASDIKSSDSCENASDSESTDNENVPYSSKDQDSSAINSKLRPVGENFDICDSKEISLKFAKPEVGESPQTRTKSNEKRLDALLERRKIAQAQKNLIKDALKGLDSSAQSHDGRNHIVFSDSDGNEGDDNKVKKATYSVGVKISGSKASSWLGLDSDSDDDCDHTSHPSAERNNQLVKPQFEGKSGEELFKLQRTYGGDKRFDLDVRFLESDEDDDDNNDVRRAARSVAQKRESRGYEGATPREDEDEISKSIQEEKQMAFKVIRNILGADFRADYSGQGVERNVPEFRSSSLVHYDPTREDHKQFEKIVEEETEEPDEKLSLSNEKQTEEAKLPDVSYKKYYVANTSVLTNLFGGKKEGTSFTFLSQERDDDVESTPEDLTLEGTVEILKSNPWQATPKLPYDSSDDDDKDDTDNDYDSDDNTELNYSVGSGAIGLGETSSPPDELFFFHPDDSILANRIDDREAPFMRTVSPDEVSEHWVTVRSDLTQDYKKKRKDAIRRKNKLAAKRPRHR